MAQVIGISCFPRKEHENKVLFFFYRYTLWVPLYPVGFVCEGVIALRDIPYFEETGRFSYPLPNSWNLSFHFPTVLRLYLLLFFFPLLYTMMNHMYRQRCKKLGITPHAERRRRRAEEAEAWKED